ncbi:MAG TPA: helix-turn-helix domain-containing protein, partial [Candidatus Saccharimonadales bacterium]|nr:helix-turn-helix domain-containing protein [Candidatus Saccharimonadales bacterium]
RTLPGQSYDWPGNVRELRNIVERLTIMGPPGRIAVSDLPAEIGGGASSAAPPGAPGAFTSNDAQPLREARELFERWYIGRVLARNGNNVTRTAEALGVERSHLHRKLKAYGMAAGKSAVPASTRADGEGSGG